MVTSDLLKIAFGISELLSRKYPAIACHVLRGLYVEENEIMSAGIISDKFQITITGDRILFNARNGEHVNVARSLNPGKRVFELPDPYAIDKLLDCVDEHLKVSNSGGRK